MAQQSKKANTKSSSVKKKTTGNKKPVKRKRRSKSKKSSSFKKNIFIILGVFLLISMVSFGYFLGQNNTQNVKPKKTEAKKVQSNKVKITQKKPSKEKVIVQTIKPQKTLPLEKKVVPKKVYPEIKKEIPKEKVAIKKETSVEKIKVTSHKKVVLAYQGSKPKLVIIIDDVHTRNQINAIKALGLKVTPSIFPPYQLAAKSHLLARGVEHYMIHLPMESSSKQFNTQTKTLMTYFTKAQIEHRVKELRRLFPTAHYINNHTGSVYTGNYKAMNALYSALRKEGFLFVDSRTIGSSKVPKITRQFGDAYIARDIFIDNEHSLPYIHNQLQKAVGLAKKNGYAIAIGHPHKVTMQALASANKILKDVELVYIDSIYKKER